MATSVSKQGDSPRQYCRRLARTGRRNEQDERLGNIGVFPHEFAAIGGQPFEDSGIWTGCPQQTGHAIPVRDLTDGLLQNVAEGAAKRRAQKRRERGPFALNLRLKLELDVIHFETRKLRFLSRGYEFGQQKP
jgi:hypothetical protein